VRRARNLTTLELSGFQFSRLKLGSQAFKLATQTRCLRMLIVYRVLQINIAPLQLVIGRLNALRTLHLLLIRLL
jgi:hypothetical protein